MKFVACCFCCVLTKEKQRPPPSPPCQHANAKTDATRYKRNQYTKRGKQCKIKPVQSEHCQKQNLGF